MIPLHRNKYHAEPETDSVMKRTVEGIINFWNRSAEDLYGWKKEEAIGRVSHELLQTQFPKPLEEIDAELVTKGQWEGKLIHATRNGGHVVVESRWIIDQTKKPAAVVEINAPVERENKHQAHPNTSVGPKRRELFSQTAGLNSQRRDKTVKLLTYTGLLALVVAWVFYVVFGHQLIQDIYHGRAALPFLDRILEGRAFTPIQNYLQAADKLMLLGTVWLVTIYLTVVFLLKHPVGALLAAFSFMVTSFLVFCFFELAPSLIKPLGLDAIPYYAYQLYFLDDDGLIYREKPFNHIIRDNYRSEHYSALYGIEVPPVHFEWITDKNGFRNSHTREYSDIIALGDSYLEWGNTEADTFVKRLENKLPGLTATNLGKSGYGPPQYLEVLNRYGVKYRPKYALIAFFEGNDVLDTKAYFRWKKGQIDKQPDLHRMAQLSFFQRYWLALETEAAFIRNGISYWIKLALNKIAQHQGYAYDIHPDLAVLNLGDGESYKIKFVEHLDTRSPKEMLVSEEWRQLKTVLTDIREACEKNGISLIVMYIPAAANVYAQYSTKQSGENWLQIREQQIQAKTNTEEAMRQVVQDLNIELISLSPVLEAAAQQGKLLYYPLDPHWNAEGTEIAASYVAETLKSRYLSASSTADQ